MDILVKTCNQNYLKLPFTEEKWKKVKYLTQNSIRFRFVKKIKMQNPKSPSNSSNTTVRISADDWKDLKPYWKSGNMATLLWWSTSLLFISFSKTLPGTETRLIGWQILVIDLSPEKISRYFMWKHYWCQKWQYLPKFPPTYSNLGYWGCFCSTTSATYPLFHNHSQVDVDSCGI